MSTNNAHSVFAPLERCNEEYLCSSTIDAVPLTLSPANSNYLCLTTVTEVFLVFLRTQTQSDMVPKILDATADSLFVFPK
jgi:hypothetical protein